jgi:hypothetical protein
MYLRQRCAGSAAARQRRDTVKMREYLATGVFTSSPVRPSFTQTGIQNAERNLDGGSPSRASTEISQARDAPPR